VQSSSNYFRIFSRITAIITLVVVLAGSLVKVTGSGMGCPDWPKCFGHYIPPFNEQELKWETNTDYFDGQMIIHEGQLLVSQSDFTSKEVFDSTSWKVYDKHSYTVYNPLHTVIEYINRLATVILGFAVLLMLAFSVPKLRIQPALFIWSFVVLVLILFEAWLGRLVVDSLLAPLKISIHLYAAFVIVLIISALLVFTNTKYQESSIHLNRRSVLTLVMLFLLCIQVFLGTKVRELFDVFADQYVRNDWPIQAGLTFLVHRSFSLVYGATAVFYFVRYRNSLVSKEIYFILGLIFLSIISGIVMGYFGVPKAMQPTHIFLSGVLMFFQGLLTFKTLKQ
jgi:cytochrome c oxidase assembly protein subunit 15